MSDHDPQLSAPSRPGRRGRRSRRAVARAHPARPRRPRAAVSSLVVGGAFLAAAIPLAVLPSSERSPLVPADRRARGRVRRDLARAVRGRCRVRDPDAARARADAVRGADRAGAAARRCSGSSRASCPRTSVAAVPLERVIVVPASAWHAVGPAVVLLAAGEGPAELVALAASTSRRSPRSSSSTSRARRSASGSRSAISPRAHLR